MKHTFWVMLLTAFAVVSLAVTAGAVETTVDVNSSGLMTDNGWTEYTFTVSGLGALTDVNFRFSALHNYDGDLRFFLRDPGGMESNLIDGVGGGSNNFQDTYLDDEAAYQIYSGTGRFAPFPGPEYPVVSNEVPNQIGQRFKTKGASLYSGYAGLTTFNGRDPNGTWTLRILDRYAGDAGYLLKAGDATNVAGYFYPWTRPGGPTNAAIGTQLILTAPVVPEPGSMLALATGLIGLVALGRRRR